MNSRLRAFYGFEPFCLQKKRTVAAIIKFVGDGLDHPLLLKPPPSLVTGEVARHFSAVTEGAAFPTARVFRINRRGGPVCPPVDRK